VKENVKPVYGLHALSTTLYPFNFALNVRLWIKGC